MNLVKRKLIKFLGFSVLSTIFFPINFLIASAKKVINPNLTKKQKNVMFNEGTEKPFSSELLNEKREGFYHCANWIIDKFLSCIT